MPIGVNKINQVYTAEFFIFLLHLIQKNTFPTHFQCIHFLQEQHVWVPLLGKKYHSGGSHWY